MVSFSANLICISLNLAVKLVWSHRKSRTRPSSRPAVSKGCSCHVYVKVVIEHKSTKLFLAGFSL